MLTAIFVAAFLFVCFLVVVRWERKAKDEAKVVPFDLDEFEEKIS